MTCLLLTRYYVYNKKSMRQVSIILISTVFIFKEILNVEKGWSCLEGHYRLNINDIPLIIILCFAINKLISNKAKKETFSQ
jgi:hypothetical protein